MPRIVLVFCVLTLVLPSAWGRSDIGYPRLMQGPILGAVTPAEILVWVRTSDEFPVEIEYALTEDLADSRRTPAVIPRKADDFTAVIPVTGLEAGTTYFYRVLVNGSGDPNLRSEFPFTMKTAPAGPAAFSIAFGSCARVQRDPVQPIWDVVADLAPDLFFWVGDNIYGDSLQASTLAEEYRRQRDVPSMQAVNRTIPQLAIWDDHDYGLNDHDRTNPIKEQALEVHKQYWANPGYGTDAAPGCYFAYHYGGVDFLFIDCRYYRDPNADPDTPEKTFLGADQLAWLKERLQASTAPFKVVVSGSGWTAAKGPGGDSWSSFLHERNALFDFIRDENIAGVVLMSGDTHTGECNAIPWSEHGGYDFYDLVSSPLAQSPSRGWRSRSPEARLRPGFEKPNAGLVTFDMTLPDPVLTFNLYDENGETAWESLVITASELRNGAVSYTEKVRYSPE